MNKVIPWDLLCDIIKPFYLQTPTERKKKPLNFLKTKISMIKSQYCMDRSNIPGLNDSDRFRNSKGKHFSSERILGFYNADFHPI